MFLASRREFGSLLRGEINDDESISTGSSTFFT